MKGTAMKTLRFKGDVRLALLVCAAMVVTACGQRDEAADESAATGMAKVPVTTSSEEARAHYEEGRRLADNLRFVEANEKFSDAVEADPGFAMAYYMLAFTSQSTADYFDAVAKAAESMGNATDGEQLYVRQLVAIAENDQAAQLEAVSSLLSMYPKDERTHFALASYHNGQQNFADAVTHYEHATQINADFAPAWNALGYARRGLGDLEGAKEAFARYVELIPDEPNPYDSYAELLMEMGEYDESIANYRKALEIDPHFPSAYAGISINESLKGNPEAAQAAAEEMLAAARNNAEQRGAMFQSVTAHLYAGRIDEAIDTAEQLYALAKEQEDLAAMGDVAEYIGDIMSVTGDGAGAFEYYMLALENRLEAPVNDATKERGRRTHLFKSAIAAIVADDLDTAKARAAEYTVSAEAAGSAFERRRIHELAGYIAAMDGDNEASARELAQANQLDPIVLYWQAVANRELGNEDKAAELAAMAAYKNTISPNLPLFRGQAISLLQDLEESEQLEAE